MEDVFMHPALLQEQANGKIRCHACKRRCLIVPGGKGWCRARENLGGQLLTLIYGFVSSMAANLVEKKPFYPAIRDGPPP